MTVLVSACLLGTACRYDGQSKVHPLAAALLKKHTAIPVCPEILGGLSTPRPPAERKGNGVFTESGADVTENYHRGAQDVFKLARLSGRAVAFLKVLSHSLRPG